MRALCLLIFLSTGPDWTYDYQKALQDAKATDKVVLVVFSGSDWCKPCIQLHRDLFETSTFVDFAAEHLILVKADFPYARRNRLSAEQTAHNEALAERYNTDGVFPLGVFINSAGEELGRFTFDKQKSPDDYLTLFKKIIE